jgi:hypothetical protein
MWKKKTPEFNHVPANYLVICKVNLFCLWELGLTWPLVGSTLILAKISKRFSMVLRTKTASRAFSGWIDAPPGSVSGCGRG